MDAIITKSNPQRYLEWTIYLPFQRVPSLLYLYFKGQREREGWKTQMNTVSEDI